MIVYEGGKWGIAFAFSWSGGAINKALTLALPLAILSVGVTLFRVHVMLDEPKTNLLNIMGGYMFPLGFMLIFKTQVAYSRFWEGSALIQQAKGSWFNVVSSCVAFSTTDPEKQDARDGFHHELVRLMSILFCSSLHRVSMMEHIEFEIIEHQGVDGQILSWMAEKPEKCEIVMQWIQRLIVENLRSGTLAIAPPILTRVFQDLSQGVVDINNARRIRTIPLPFPYAQMLSVLLMLHCAIVPIIVGLSAQNMLKSFLFTFLSVLALWSLTYIAQDIEMPFGLDENDLPLREFTEDMNQGMKTLLDARCQFLPEFHFDRELHQDCTTRMWGGKNFNCPIHHASQGIKAPWNDKHGRP